MVGVTGHRALDELDRVAAGIDQALAAIAAAFPGRPLRLMSLLAEGGDRLVVQRALRQPGASFEAVLPLERRDYEQDFRTEESRREFTHLLDRAAKIITVPPTESREAAYEAAGRYVVGRADVLIAVWDGEAGQGRGGTGGVVADARRHGLPLAWVHAGNRHPGTLEPTTLGATQGTVTYERLPA